MGTNDYIKAINELKNDSQEKAILYLDNAVFSACPGSGKTKTVVLKVAYLMNEIIKSPQGLACITFSKNSAQEFEKRYKNYDSTNQSRLFFGTVHSFCLSEVIFNFGKIFLKEIFNEDTRVANSDEIEEILKESFIKNKIDLSKNRFAFNSIRRLYHNKNKRLESKKNQFIQVVKDYEAKLRDENLIDFEDIIYYSRRLIEVNTIVKKAICAKFPWFIIDEYQDLGYSLHKIILALLETNNVKIFAVGDPHQSIYGFNGANPTYLKELADKEDFELFKSKFNYRCCQPIIDASINILKSDEKQSFESKIQDPSSGAIFIQECSRGIDGQIEFMINTILPAIKEKGIKNGDIGILSMYNDSINYLHEKLKQKTVPSVIVKDIRYEITPLTNWINDLARWCAGGWAINSPLLEELFTFWFNYKNFITKPKTKPIYLNELELFYNRLLKLKEKDYSLKEWVSLVENCFSIEALLKNKVFLKELKYHSDSFEQFSNMVYTTNFGNQTLSEFKGVELKKDKIILMTLHSSKGLQFKCVIMFNLEEGVIPSWRQDNLAEGRRLFYVGITRAKNEVYLLWSGFTKNQYGRIFKNGKSRFISELIDGKNCMNL